MIFDSSYDPYRGVVAYIRVVDGEIRRQDRVRLMSAGVATDAEEVGVFAPDATATSILAAGDVGYLVTGVKDVRQAKVGDTVTAADRPAKAALPGYREPKPMVWSGLYPADGGDYPLELRRALDTMKERDSRRFFLRNTAPNLAGAEMQELVKAAIESNGGRITTSQNTSPREDGRFKQIGVNVQFFATTPSLQKLLGVLESQQPYLLVDNITIRPLNAFRGFKPGPGMEPEVNVQLDVSAFAYADTKPAAAGAVAAPK